MLAGMDVDDASPIRREWNTFGAGDSAADVRLYQWAHLWMYMYWPGCTAAKAGKQRSEATRWTLQSPTRGCTASEPLVALQPWRCVFAWLAVLFVP